MLHFVIDAPPSTTLAAGDAFGILPPNSYEDVTTLCSYLGTQLAVLSLSHSADVDPDSVIAITPANSTHQIPTHLRNVSLLLSFDPSVF